MTTLYKLTTSDFRTRPGMPGETYWSEGFTLDTSGEGELCGPGFVHAYTHPLLAVLLNPVHANYRGPVMWECDGEIVKDDSGLKVGCTRLTTLRRIPLPAVTTEQRVRFAILCTLEVYSDAGFARWSDFWLRGVDRSADAARAAARAARAAVYAARAARAAADAARAAGAAVYAADAAADAAVYAVYAADAAVYAAAGAAGAAVYAVYAAARAARAAADAAGAAVYAARAGTSFDFAAIAEKAVQDS